MMIRTERRIVTIAIMVLVGLSILAAATGWDL